MDGPDLALAVDQGDQTDFVIRRLHLGPTGGVDGPPAGPTNFRRAENGGVFDFGEEHRGALDCFLPYARDAEGKHDPDELGAKLNTFVPEDEAGRMDWMKSLFSVSKV